MSLFFGLSKSREILVSLFMLGFSVMYYFTDPFFFLVGFSWCCQEKPTGEKGRLSYKCMYVCMVSRVQA